MGSRIVKCPSGKYAAFSDIVDHFIAYDMTRDEALQFCVDRWDLGPQAAENKVQSGDEDVTEKGTIGRFEESIEIIALMHGKEESTKYRVLLGR